MKALFIFLLVIFLFPNPVYGELVEKLDFNPEYDSLDFSVEGSIDFRVLFFPAGMDFTGSGENFKGATPIVSIDDASLRLFSLSFGGSTAEQLGEDIVGEAVGIAATPEDVLRVYDTKWKDNHLYFLYKPLSESADEDLIDLVRDRKISDLAVESGYEEGRVYGGRITFQGDLISDLLALSDDWWADLEVDWKDLGKYNFPERVEGDGYYETNLELEVDFYDYEIY